MLVRALPLFIPLSRDALPVSSPTRQHITKDMNCISKMNGLTDEQVISLTPLAPRKSPTFSTFNPDNLLPEPPIDVVMPHPLEPRKGISSPSDSGVSAVFEPLDDVPDQALADLTQPTTPPDEPAQFDLNPPPPSVSIANAESLHEKLYSADHLNIILRDPAMLSKFTSYVHTHRPYLVPVLSRYLDAQKAKSAVDYANAVAECMSSRRSHAAAHPPAAFLDSKFESQSLRAEEKLVNDALPGYITHRLVQLVTECLVKEITGSIAPIMQALVSGLAEVYCMTDPSLPDNPIVYASEEFYNVTQYGREYVIGRNCRFLQGPKTAPHSVSRLSKALSSGISVCETILNYRRDGSPFINLVMSAPLYDNKGRIRYFIGCQIDITNLIQGGRGLESFQRLLAQDRSESQFDTEPEKNTLKALNDFGTLLNENEIEALKRREIESQESPEPCSGRNTPAKPGSLRRYFGLDEALDHSQWTEPHLGRSGRLPGVYQNVCYQQCDGGRVLTKLTVLSCSSMAFAQDHFHVSFAAHPWSRTNKLHGSHWRPSVYS